MKKKELFAKIMRWVPKLTRIKTVNEKYKEGDKGVFGFKWTIKF